MSPPERCTMCGLWLASYTLPRHHHYPGQAEQHARQAESTKQTSVYRKEMGDKGPCRVSESQPADGESGLSKGNYERWTCAPGERCADHSMCSVQISAIKS